ncbi:MAG: hypothetical protein ABR881_29980 [Candidatus Sulfotelmatobacter sp.]|jgi:hypothetical protein
MVWNDITSKLAISSASVFLRISVGDSRGSPMSARLDQMLKAAVDADGQVLRSAAARLDQLLEDIATGKDVTHDLKRRRNWQKRGDG